MDEDRWKSLIERFVTHNSWGGSSGFQSVNSKLKSVSIECRASNYLRVSSSLKLFKSIYNFKANVLSSFGSKLKRGPLPTIHCLGRNKFSSLQITFVNWQWLKSFSIHSVFPPQLKKSCRKFLSHENVLLFYLTPAIHQTSYRISQFNSPKSNQNMRNWRISYNSH